MSYYITIRKDGKDFFEANFDECSIEETRPVVAIYKHAKDQPEFLAPSTTIHVKIDAKLYLPQTSTPYYAVLPGDIDDPTI
jgi:hypothetical protein